MRPSTAVDNVMQTKTGLRKSTESAMGRSFNVQSLDACSAIVLTELLCACDLNCLRNSAVPEI